MGSVKEKLKQQCKESCDKRNMQGVINALASLYGLWKGEENK